MSTKENLIKVEDTSIENSTFKSSDSNGDLA